MRSLHRFLGLGKRSLRSGRAADLFTLTIGLGIGGVLWRSGWLAGLSAALVEMGFDPDRARLIGSLVAAFGAGVIATLLTGRRVASTLMSLVVLSALFNTTFERETRQALAASGSDGRFDPAGWTMTIVALIGLGLTAGCIAAVLAGTGRSWMLQTARAARSDLRGGAVRLSTVGRGAALMAIVVVTATALPVLGDMFNFSPDARMRRGAPPPIGLFGGASGGTPSQALSSPSAAASNTTTVTAGGGSATSASAAGSTPPTGIAGLPASVTDLQPVPGTSALATYGAIRDDRPWQAWQPSGSGAIDVQQLPAPWVGGTSPTIEVAIYLPPGYDATSRRYPVVYELPWPLSIWSGALQFPAVLDALIGAGQVPPEIAVFVSDRGGPYPDSECQDSYDGREWFDSFVSGTLPRWVDARYRTIATPAARTLLGFSVGGFCASSVLLRHADVFGQAIAMDGYFDAAPQDRQTLNAGLPYGNDPARMAAASPMYLARTIRADVRGRLLQILAGDPTTRFYGAQMQGFAGILDATGMPFAWVPSDLGHSWAAVRQTAGTALEIAAFRMNQQGVFGP